MAWGERAAEQYEQNQPSEISTCVRPDGVSPELDPLRDRKDFETRIGHVLSRHRTWSNFGEWQNRADRLTYAEEQVRKLETEEDQLVLMRAAQILDEAEARRQSVMRKLAKPTHACEAWQMQESAKGGRYCAACGAPEVPDAR